VQFVQKFNSGHVRHLIVRDHEIIVLNPKPLPSEDTIFGGVNVISMVNQGYRVQPAQIPVILHYKDSVRLFWPEVFFCCGFGIDYFGDAWHWLYKM
jgi:hypothetical protein